MNGNITITTTSQDLKTILKNLNIDLTEVTRGTVLKKVILQNNGSSEIRINTLGDAVIGKGLKLETDGTFNFQDANLEDIKLISDVENPNLAIIVL